MPDLTPEEWRELGAKKMAPGHTPEPWRHIREGAYDRIVDDKDRDICTWDHRGRSEEPSKEDADRIIACVNAMADIPYPKTFMHLVKQLVMDASEPCGCADNVALAERCRRIMEA